MGSSTTVFPLPYPFQTILELTIAIGAFFLMGWVIVRSVRAILTVGRQIIIGINALVELAPVLMTIGSQFNERPGYFKKLLEDAEANTNLALAQSSEAKEGIKRIEDRLGKIETGVEDLKTEVTHLKAALEAERKARMQPVPAQVHVSQNQVGDQSSVGQSAAGKGIGQDQTS